MAKMKITVVGDGADEQLSPDEEQRIEQKIDAMLDPSVPDQAQPAPVTPEPTTTPEVTKIETTVADTEPIVEEPEPVPEPAPKPAVKKIAVFHHDDVPVEEPKPKAAAKKTAKKTKVAVQSEDPKDDLAATTDAIAASALAAEEMIGTKSEPVPEPEPDVEVPAEELVETTEDESGGAPPLIQKHAAAPIGVDETAEPETTEEPLEPEEPAEPVATPVAKKIAVEIPIEEIEDPAEDITVEVEEPVSEEAVSEEKKYVPPAGPIEFKRAEVPIQPLKPGEARPLEPIDELSEDEALAKAFEAPKATQKAKSPRKLSAGLRKSLKWVVLLFVIASIAAAALIPSIRTKALKLVGLDSKPKTSAPAAATNTDVPAATASTLSPDVFMGKKDGIYNLYKLAPSSQTPELVLAGTGSETDKIAMAPNAAGTVAALVSTRDAKRNSAGALQQSVSLVDIANKKPEGIDTADQIKLIDWFGNTVVYVLLNTSTSTSDPNRYQIVSYDTVSKKRTVVDHMNYLNDVLAAQGLVYYAVGTSNGVPGRVSSSKPDGTDKKTLITTEIAAITRTAYNEIILSGVSKWYNYHFGDVEPSLTSNVTQKSRLYVDNPDGKLSIYINDNKQLVLTDTATDKETILKVTTAANPVHWVGSDVLVYRSGTTDYRVSVSGGEPTKLADVASVAGISLWHEQ